MLTQRCREDGIGGSGGGTGGGGGTSALDCGAAMPWSSATCCAVNGTAASPAVSAAHIIQSRRIIMPPVPT